jgi:V/A-type H+-transporting ATPase subunit I
MILKMSKLLFVGADDRKQEFLSRLQKEGVLQIEEYRGDKFVNEDITPDSAKAEAVHAAAKTLKRYEEEHPDLLDEVVTKDSYDGDLPGYIDELNKKYQSLHETKSEIEYKIENITPWGNFEYRIIEDIQIATNTVIQFWEVSSKVAPFFEIDKSVFKLQVCSQNHRDYFITFSDKKIQLANCIEHHIQTDLTTLFEQLASIDEEISDTIFEVLSYRTFKNKLLDEYLKELNSLHYDEALSFMVKDLDGLIFALQGWTASSDIENLNRAAAEFNVQLIEIEPDPGEKVPTKMKNKGLPELGQDLVTFYDTPAQSDWDPSGWVFLSFILFFAMIMGDGGYGLTLFILLLFFRIKGGKKLKGGGLRAINMGMVLTFSTFVYGTLFSGFYGVNLPIPGLDYLKESVNSPVIDGYVYFKSLADGDAVKNGILMRVSVLIGLGHISLSLFLKALRDFSTRQFITPFANFAWIVIIWLFYFLYSASGGNLGAFQTLITTEPNSYIMLSALGIVFVTSAGTFNPVKIIFGGLGGLYNGIQFFSDVLSYIRIFALGLSGSLIAIVFNDLGLQVMGLNMQIAGVDLSFIAIILGVLVIVFGHILNIALCLMGAVIHGLRLNFLEYYRWSFDGDGKPFKPFKDLLT